MDLKMRLGRDWFSVMVFSFGGAGYVLRGAWISEHAPVLLDEKPFRA